MKPALNPGVTEEALGGGLVGVAQQVHRHPHQVPRPPQLTRTRGQFMYFSVVLIGRV